MTIGQLYSKFKVLKNLEDVSDVLRNDLLAKDNLSKTCRTELERLLKEYTEEIKRLKSEPIKVDEIDIVKYDW